MAGKTPPAFMKNLGKALPAPAKGKAAPAKAAKGHKCPTCGKMM